MSPLYPVVVPQHPALHEALFYYQNTTLTHVPTATGITLNKRCDEMLTLLINRYPRATHLDDLKALYHHSDAKHRDGLVRVAVFRLRLHFDALGIPGKQIIYNTTNGLNLSTQIIVPISPLIVPEDCVGALKTLLHSHPSRKAARLVLLRLFGNTPD